VSLTVAKQSRSGIRELLLVDDEPADALLAKEALRVSGAQLTMSVVSSGQAAVSWLSKRADLGDAPQFILVLLDLNMPVWDGEATLKQIRSDPKICLTPVVILTTSNNERDMKRAYEAGAYGYVCKPLNFPDFTKFFANLDSSWGHYLAPQKAPLSEPRKWL